MKICLETSSLIPLILSTPYTVRLFDHIVNQDDNSEYYIFKDCIREAENAKFLQISSYECVKNEQTHTNYGISIIRNINESFTAQNLHHNYARGCSIFVMDILDKISYDLEYNEYCKLVHNAIKTKINRIISFINKEEFTISNKTLNYYWWIKPEIQSDYDFQINVKVIGDEEAESTINKDRDIYHFEQFYEGYVHNVFDELWVCDSGYKNQIRDLKNDKYTKDVRKKIRHFNKKK